MGARLLDRALLLEHGKRNRLNPARFGIDQQDAIDIERDAVFEELATGRRRVDPWGKLAGFHLGHEACPLLLNQVIGAQADGERLAINPDHVFCGDLCAQYFVAELGQPLGGVRLTRSRAGSTGASTMAAKPRAGRSKDTVNEQAGEKE